MPRQKKSLCAAPACPGHSKCKDCHAVYMRDYRKDNPVSEDQRLKTIARSYARVYLKRGKIVKRPCEVCESDESQMHHEDYSKPTAVNWLCPRDHRKHHRLKALGQAGLVTIPEVEAEVEQPNDQPLISREALEAYAGVDYDRLVR